MFTPSGDGQLQNEEYEHVGNALHELRAQVVDVLNATARLLRAMQSTHSAGSTPADDYVFAQARSSVEQHETELREHVQRLGGANVQPPSNAASAERLTPGEVVARLSMLHAASLMLETNARALGFFSTAALAARHREELEKTVSQLRATLDRAA